MPLPVQGNVPWRWSHNEDIYLDGMAEGEIRHWDRRGDVATEGTIQQALQTA